MKRMTVPAFLAAAVLAFSLAGCSSAQSMTEDTLKGVWSLESGSDLGITGYISFEDDNVVEMILADGWLDGTYSVSGTSGSIEFTSYEDEAEDEGEEGESSTSSSSAASTAKLTYSNNKLTVGSSDGSKLVFVKDDSEEAKEMFAFDYDDEDLVLDGEGDEGFEYVDEVIDPIDPAVTVADDDICTITVTGKGTDFTGDPGYQLSITNKTDKTIYFAPEDDFTVGDKKIEAGLGDEVEAGGTLETFMYFAQDDLGGALEALGVTDGVIQVFDDESDDELASYPFHME